MLVDNELRSRDDPIIEELHDLDRNHTANLLRAIEYPLALARADPLAGDATILSYRAGFRFGELDWIGHAQWVKHHGVETILLDHTPYARLKRSRAGVASRSACCCRTRNWIASNGFPPILMLASGCGHCAATIAN